MSNLLDRLFDRARRLNWRYALRIALITAAFYAICPLIGSIVIATAPFFRGFSFKEIMAFIPVLVREFRRPDLPLGLVTVVGLFSLPYWAIFALAALSDQTNPVHRWRVRLAWLLMTFPFAAAYSLSLFEKNAFPIYVYYTAYPLLLTALSPLVTFLVVVADHLVRQLFRWLQGSDNNSQSSPST